MEAIKLKGCVFLSEARREDRLADGEAIQEAITEMGVPCGGVGLRQEEFAEIFSRIPPEDFLFAVLLCGSEEEFALLRSEWAAMLSYYHERMPGDVRLPVALYVFVGGFAAEVPEATVVVGRAQEGLDRIVAWVEKQVFPKTEERAPSNNPNGGRRAALWMLHDRHVMRASDDRLDFKPYAEAIAGLIDNPKTGTPLTIAINAPWGSGKSSLAAMVKERLERKPAAGGGRLPHVCMWFNAWMHDDANSVSAAFVAAVARAAHLRRGPWRRFWQPLPSRLCDPVERTRRLRWLLFLVGLPVLGIAAVLIGKIPELAKIIGVETSKTQGASGWLFTALAAVPALFKGATALFPSAKALGAFVADPAKEASGGHLPLVRSQLHGLLDDATPPGSRFVVFIDDLERCRPPTAIDLLEIANQLLDHPNVVLVVIADIPAIAASADIKYKELAQRYDPARGALSAARDGAGASAYGRLYLQKFIQMQFDIPPQTSGAMRQFAGKLATPREEEKTTAEPGAAKPGDEDVVALAFREEGAFVKEFRRRKAKSRRGSLGWWQAWFWLRYPAYLAMVAGARWALPSWSREGPLLIPLRTEGLAILANLLTLVVVTMVLGSGMLLRGVVTLVHAAIDEVFRPYASKPPNIEILGVVIDFGTTAGLLAVLAGGGAWLLLALQARGNVRRASAEYEEQVQRAREEIERHFKGNGFGTGPIAGPQDGATLGQDGWDALVREQQQMSVASDEALLNDALNEIFRHIPSIPRNVKRVMNRLRLWLFVAVAKDLFSRPGVGPAHIGKWVVLQERWPDFAQRLVRDCSKLRDLEKVEEGFDTTTGKLGLDSGEIPALRDYFRTPPHLSTVAPLLMGCGEEESASRQTAS